MPARKKITKRAKIEITEGQEAWLHSLPYDDVATGFSFFCAYFGSGLLKFQGTKELWDNYKADILKQWIEKKPCSRPERWWDFDAPEAKLKIAGSSTQKDNSPPWSKSSIPDRPCFESEAQYLMRLNLLTTAEKQHLKKHPELLQSEVI